jgi:hypothetical protein
VTAECKVKIGAGIPRGQKDPPPTQPAAFVRDYWRVKSTLSNNAFTTSPEYGKKFPAVQNHPDKYDRIVLHAGVVGDECGQPKQIGCGNVVPLEAAGRMVGMKTGDGAIRILGAAAQVYPGLPAPNGKNLGDTPAEKMWRYRNTLPASAVPDGFILSALNIAAANRFFDKFPNTNINTASPEELTAALRKVGIMLAPEKLAASIVRARNVSNGFKDGDDVVAKIAKPADDAAAEEVKRLEAQYLKDLADPTLDPGVKVLRKENTVLKIAQVKTDATMDKKRAADNREKLKKANFGYTS